MKTQKGFTLIELILVIGLFAALTSFVVITLLKPQVTASLDTTVTTLISDIKSQQIKAINGYQDSSQSIQLNQYSYTIGDLTVDLDPGIEINPSEELIFLKDGSIQNYNALNNTFTITHTSGETKVININKYGVINEN